jgi:hypothetical protein
MTRAWSVRGRSRSEARRARPGLTEPVETGHLTKRIGRLTYYRAIRAAYIAYR